MAVQKLRRKYKGILRAEMKACKRRLEQLLARSENIKDSTRRPFFVPSGLISGFNGKTAAENLIVLLDANIRQTIKVT